MDWIHCNNCRRQPNQEKGNRFQLTSCGHIYCLQCVEVSTKPACKVCGSKCNCMPLSSNMGADIQTYFSDPEETIRKALQVYAFQKGHRQQLMVALRANRSMENQLAEENKKLRAKLIEQAKYIAKLESKLIQFKQMTAALPTPLRVMPLASPRTPTFLSPTPSVSSQLTAGLMPSQQAVKRISPHFAGSSDAYNRMGNRISPALGKILNSSEMSNRQKCSPRERLVNYAPDRSSGKM